MDNALTTAKLKQYLFSRGTGAIVGVGLGVLSMFLPWVSLTYRLHGVPLFIDPFFAHWSNWAWGPATFLELIGSPTYSGPLLVFLFGTIVAVFTRLGGLVQAAGLVGFVLAARPGPPTIDSYSFPYDPLRLFMVGYFLAVVSTMIVMFGGRRFAWNSRDYGNVPAIGRMTALLPHSTNVMK